MLCLARRFGGLPVAGLFALLLLLVPFLTGPGVETPQVLAGGGGLTPIRLQLQWTPQAQFAGYLAADALGFYEAEGLDVSFLPGGVDIVPQDAVTRGDAEFAIAWVPKALVSREAGAPLVNVAQVFERSGTLEVSWRDSGIREPADWRGKRVGTWGFGNELELLAALDEAGLTPGRDVTVVPQRFDMGQLLDREIDAAQAMTYNEYAMLLLARDPATGRTYQPEDFSVIDFNEAGTAMLQDAIWAHADRLADAWGEDITRRFLRASFRGWVYCRDHRAECVEITLRYDPTLDPALQTWQLNEVNKLIWPSPDGIGVMDRALWLQTIRIATSHGVLSRPPDAGAFRSDLAREAIAALAAQGVDVRGLDYRPRRVTLGGD